jgi:copper/silver efflux system protein
VVMAVTIIPFKRLGSEFMPPLNEGTMLFMPTAVPGMSINETTKVLQIQNRQLRKIPEVQTVFGKAGQAESSTDPAPLSMFETVVTFKPPGQWRPGMTWDKIIAEMNANIKTPGMANIFWQPIQTRTEMLTTGFRSKVGIKIFGPDLGKIQELGSQIEKVLSDFPATRSVYAERTTGGYFLDFDVNRETAARYGLTVGDVNDVVESAIGGKTVTTTVEGRERYPVSVRYARDFRQDIDALKRVLVPTPTGAQVPISMLADINYKTGPPSIRNENGQLVGFVFVDITTSDIDGYVRSASQKLSQSIQFPPGYYIQWAGQFEYLQAALKKLKVVIPFTLLIIFVLLYINMRSVTKTFIVLLAVPFSLVGAFWLIYLLAYNMSVAVWIGIIALAGLDAETGVVMLLYLDHAWEKFRTEGRMNNFKDLHDAVIEGAVQRIRPKIMTVCAILFGLLPIMWSPATEAGADVMKPIATPMIGGIVTSAIMELLIYPVIFALWKKRGLKEHEEEEAPFVPPILIPSEKVRRRLPRIIATIVIAAALIYSGSRAWQNWSTHSASHIAARGEPLAVQTVDDLTVKVFGDLRNSESDLLLEFRNNAGELVDVGTVRFDLNMDMAGMTMRDAGRIQATGTPGQYHVKTTPGMAGDWRANLSYDGPHGHSATSVLLSVKSGK